MAEVADSDLKGMVKELVADVPPESVDQFTFRGEQFDRGLAVVQFPEGKGGLGISPRGQMVVNEELRQADQWYHDLNVNPIGIGMGMPTLLAHGAEDLHGLLRSCFTGEDIWCQLFSEPGSGSDVAGLSSRAGRDGDEWIVNGQKVWTTLAHTSKWGMLMARTDPEAPKHRGMTYFLMDMHSPGVEVRPLFQITGEAEFNEVFMSDVRIPDSHRFGEVGEGWRVGLTTLMNERVALGGGVPKKGTGAISVLIDGWAANQPPQESFDYKVKRDRVAELWSRAEILRLTNWRARQTAKGGTPGPEGSVGKLISAELNKDIYECVVDLQGPEGMVHPPGYPMARPKRAAIGVQAPTSGFLRSRANSIEGGTSEIMRNILGERVLGLPKEPSVDKEVPWSEIVRN
jgi:alkylation response protein AidB-like acyl-CoA dehydrogenase